MPLNIRDLRTTSNAIDQQLMTLIETEDGKIELFGLVCDYLQDWANTDWLDPEDLFLVGRRLARIGFSELPARLEADFDRDINENVLTPFLEGYQSYQNEQSIVQETAPDVLGA